MATAIALVSLLVMITSSSCRNIESIDSELGFNSDLVISDVAEHMFVPESTDEYRKTQINKLKRLLKVVPFKGSKKWKKGDVELTHDFGGGKDVPIAVIVASKTKENDKYENTNKDDTKLHKNITYVQNEPVNNTTSIKNNSDETELKRSILSYITDKDIEIATIKQSPDDFVPKAYDVVIDTEFKRQEEDNTENDDLVPDVIDTSFVSLPETQTEVSERDAEYDSVTVANDDDEMPHDEHLLEGSRFPNHHQCITCKVYNFTEDDNNLKYYHLNFVFN